LGLEPANQIDAADKIDATIEQTVAALKQTTAAITQIQAQLAEPHHQDGP
jgi:hypothetical protein